MQEPELLTFLQTAATIVNDAIFVAQSLPNVESFAVGIQSCAFKLWQRPSLLFLQLHHLTYCLRH